MRLVDDNYTIFTDLEIGDVMICEDEMLTIAYNSWDVEEPYCLMSLKTMQIITKYEDIDDVIKVVNGKKVVFDAYEVLDIVPSDHITMTFN